MKSVVLFTTFYDASPAYSLNRVVQDQIRMFVRFDYKIKVIVVEGFKPVEMYAHPNVELAYIPHFPVDNEGNLPDNYKELVTKTKDALLLALKDADVCITHDIIYQPAHLIHNLASREIAAEMPMLKWLHWIHSATSPTILCSKEEARPIIQQPFPNALICFPNYADIPRVAKNYRYEESQVKWVPHPIDIPFFLGMHPLSRQIIEKHKILDADIIVVYPARLDRGKQPEHIIKTLGMMKRANRSVKFVMIDFHSTGGDKVVYREELKRTALEWGVASDVIWLSEQDQSLQYHAPHEMIRDFQLIANLYIHPCVSETYSLATQEAAVCKNPLVLNRDFPPMRQLWGEYPLYRPFSSAIDAMNGMDGDTMFQHSDGSRRAYPEHQEQFYDHLAQNLLYHIEGNPILMEHRMVRQQRSIEHVFKRFLEPLLYR